MFRATSCSSSGESIYQYNVWYMSLCAHHEENQLYQYNIRYMSLCDIYRMLYWYNWFSWWWARGCSKHVEDWNEHIRKKNCASSWSFTRIISRCTVNKTWNTCIELLYLVYVRALLSLFRMRQPDGWRVRPKAGAGSGSRVTNCAPLSSVNKSFVYTSLCAILNYIRNVDIYYMVPHVTRSECRTNSQYEDW
jgi:hypothetical protein